MSATKQVDRVMWGNVCLGETSLFLHVWDGLVVATQRKGEAKEPMNTRNPAEVVKEVERRLQQQPVGAYPEVEAIVSIP